MGQAMYFQHIAAHELPVQRNDSGRQQAVAAAQGALDLAVDYTQERKAFGQTIAQFQNTRFKLAEMKTDIALNKALLDQNMDKFSRGEMTVEDAAMIKLSSNSRLERMASNRAISLRISPSSSRILSRSRPVSFWSRMSRMA